MRVHSRQFHHWLGSIVVSLIALAAPALAQQATLQGRISTGVNQPLPDSRVIVVGTMTSAVTNAEGRFSLKNLAPGTVEVRVLRVGYLEQKKSVTLTAGGTATLDFTMQPSAVQLTEVVVTATGEQRRAEVGNAVSTIDATVRVQETPIHNMGDMLVAKAPGLSVLPGNMSGTGAQIRIRGLNSVSRSNAPIFIVDGVRMDGGSGGFGVGGSQSSRLNDLTPEEIDHIDVVKGPSAATLYGTDAANGVIVIQTKRGRAGNTHYTYTGETGTIKDPNHYWDQFAIWGHTTAAPTVQTRCILPTIGAGTCIKDSLTHTNILLDKSLTPIQSGKRSLYGMQVQGGTESARYFVSGNLENEFGPVKMPQQDIDFLLSQKVNVRGEWMNPEALQRESFRVNINGALNPQFDLSVNTSFIKSDQRLPQVDNNVNSLYYNAYTNPGFIQGYTCAAPCAGLAYNPISNIGEPLRGWAGFTPADIFQSTSLEGIQRLIGSTSMNYRPLSWLSADATTGIDLENQDNFSLCRLNECPNFGTQRQGSVGDTHNSQRIFTAQAHTQATWQARPDMSVTGTVGADYNNNESDFARASATQLSPGGQTVGSGAVKNASNAQPTATKTLGYFVQGQIAYQDRLFLTGAVRTDQNTAFGTQFKSVSYPSAQLAWAISQEKWFPVFSFLDELRLRSAYGSSGVQPGATSALRQFSATTVSLVSDQAGLLSSALGNPNLKPEVTRELEAGFDSRFLQNRETFEFTWYRKQSKDALINQNIATSVGAPVTSILKNLGAVRNTGIEASLNSQIFDSPSFGWDMTLSGSHNKNTLVTLGLQDDGKTPTPTIGTTTRQQVGYALNSYFSQAYTYADANGDGIITASEITLGDTGVYMGQPLPPDQVAFQNGFDFLRKKLRIIASLDYKGGNTINNQGGLFLCQQTDACGAKSDPSTSLYEQAREVAANYVNPKTTAGYYENGRFWRLREVSAVLRLPDKYNRYIKSQSADLVLGARNLKIWTKYTGQDPEANYSLGDAQTDFLTTAPRRYYTLRVNLHY